MKTHFKAKHPHDQLPAGVMHRSIIWKDHGPKRKGKTQKPRFRSGSFISNKMNGKEMAYKSSWECAVYECLESLPEVLAYWVEPVKIPYLFEGQTHNYLPDLRIQFDDGHIEIWEIKPSEQTSLPINKAKWESAKSYCLARNWDFDVMTEMKIDKLKKIVQDRRRKS
jgi:hypothetical protein